MEPVNPFNRLHQSLDPRPEIKHAEWNFEHERLKWLMSRLKLTSSFSVVVQISVNSISEPRLRFAAFNEYFPTFPFLMGSSLLRNIPVPWGPKHTSSDYAIHMDPYSAEPARFKNFSWVPFVAAYGEFYESVVSKAEARKTALVFPRKGFLNGMVIHNDDTEEYWTSGLSWVYKTENGKKLYVQPFVNLVDGIYRGGHGWRPS